MRVLSGTMRAGRNWRCLLGAAAMSMALPFSVLSGDVLADAPNDAAAEVAQEDRAFLDWLKELRAEARGEGISEGTLDSALRDIAPIVRVVELDRRQPEFTQTFWTYIDQRVNEERVERGRELLDRHGALLNEIHAEYGVPPRYLVAFWGLETNFGSYLGSFRVIDALVTLAYDPRRGQFFRTQLLDALRIVDEGHIEPDAMMGSWAGAMGHMQFIPTTFTGHAVDHTGDGRKDIWSSLPDAFASAANFLTNIGWQEGEIWGREVQIPEDFDLTLATLSQRKTLADWAALGVRRADGGALPQADMEGSVILPQGHAGPAFLVYENFRAIMRWNRSINYAISVGTLADRLAGLPPLSTGRDAEHPPLSREDAEEMQQLLNRLGFDAGPEDGLPGSRTRAAIRAFQEELSLPPDGYPEPAVLQRLRAHAGG